jgi:hypothetical protein
VRDGKVCYVTRYDPTTGAATGEAAPVEAASKAEAVERACGWKVVPAPPDDALASVICLGDKPGDRQYSGALYAAPRPPNPVQLWLVIYVSGEISGAVGPLPYGIEDA